MATVLVTGGAGFIGSNTVDLLIEDGYKVIVVDNLSSGKEKNINPKAEFHKVDITSDRLGDVFSKEKPEFIIHLAAQVSVPDSVKDPVFDAKVSVLGTLNILENCRKHGVKKVVFSSSAAKYGNPVKLPICEDHPCKPLSPYGVTKKVVELYLEMYNQLYGLDYNALVYSNVYGPRQDVIGEAVVAMFVTKVISGKKCVIHGDGNATRDFVFVKDVAKANLLALKKKTKVKTMNIGSGKKITINRLFEEIKKAAGKGEAEHGPEREGDIQDSYFDVGLAKKELGWESKIELEEGIKTTIEWHQNK